MKTNKWEKRFEKFWNKPRMSRGGTVVWGNGEEVKHFISQELERQRKQIIEELEKIPTNVEEYYKGWGLRERFFDLVFEVDQAISKIKEL